MLIIVFILHASQRPAEKTDYRLIRPSTESLKSSHQTKNQVVAELKNPFQDRIPNTAKRTSQKLKIGELHNPFTQAPRRSFPVPKKSSTSTPELKNPF